MSIQDQRGLDELLSEVRAWLKRNLWFEAEVLPALQERVTGLFSSPDSGAPRR